uniref:Nucleolar GTP-binding protein 1 n=1 Tax=Mucochytrium quahogii TaxID=96639 RepID=A0A7S2W610_9STRA|mmetsp:Transcript_22635/g.36065  ORF Transcript_22635/g.36065 Transcript_22635/m.36065 type:complete len:660 (+) Transcript_22635:230-2209(+)|eukprot:CAMPEP_0203749602 /NCGR_PEP_ID=MMETSP0098-20131031/4095_1 /ASSEMBLY_ACC=CAM_ASM_000208 /TAXON_ID=96639 /ORGANISM=" , Strain NY0313808BC1" /LENGTH=659 /DNA_ID=CAMNT_0050638681 /DNA_START=238 /DNA_END=2217 /DNA_ORIENTATION=+
MVVYSFKQIRPVPSANDFVDIVLSKTQRKTPTIVHQGYAIGRIRAFYMRKVKFTQETFSEKLSWILEDFPKLDDIHPFYADLCNVLYDRDHYKLALGQLNVAKNLIASISKDYVRMLKYGDTLYRCKQLKRAALGRMCTLMKKHKSSLGYLEEVRKHLSRLPSIDPNTRTLMVFGFPNVGKSSFMNKVTRADVEVQPYAFTTKSLYVGHMDYKYLRWQVLDTPGILDKPLEDRNTIEMQAITALAHLQCCLLYFVDLSEQCGWTLKQQAALFENIRPLFANKPLVIVANKIDLVPLESLEKEDKELLDGMVKNSGAVLMPMSAAAEINIAEVKQRACDLLLEQRVETKTQSNKLNGILNRLTVAMPVSRDEKERPVTIPESVLRAREAKANKTEEGDVEMDDAEPKKKTEKDLMWENGGPGVYSCDYRKYYKLRKPEYNFDSIPEIIDGKNIADFVDPDIMQKLEELEKEEDERARRETDELQTYEDAESDMDEEEKDIIGKIRRKKAQVIAKHRQEKSKNRSSPFQKQKSQTKKEFREKMEEHGYDASKVEPRRGRKRTRSVAPDGANADASRAKSTSAAEGLASRTRSQSRGRSQSAHKSEGFKSVAQKAEANKKMKRSQKRLGQFGRAGEADRFIGTKMPKHLFSGKRGSGTAQRR